MTRSRLMDSQRARHVEELFTAASEQTAAARAEFLDRACCDDSALRQELEALLAADTEAGPFLESPACGSAAEECSQSAVGDMPAEGMRIGRYQIIRVIGSGGMADVFE